MPAFAGMTRVGVAVHVRLRERRSFVITVSRRDQGRPKRGAETRNAGTDFSFHKTEFVLGSKFSRTGSLLRHERAPCPTSP
jgi:hypothetical protein